jgi:hypothetical protein
MSIEEPKPDFVIEPDQVAESLACPKCGERCPDQLASSLLLIGAIGSLPAK